MTKLQLRKRHLLAIPILMAFVALIAALLPYRHAAAPEQKSTTDVNVVTYTSDSPKEEPIPSSYVSTAVGDEPKYLRFPSINAAGYVTKVGIDQHNQVASPNNVNLAGWYINSLKPGQAGLSIIDGHVDGKKGPGIFSRLGELKPNDLYEVELANGTKLSYQVQRLTTLKVAEVPDVLFAYDPSLGSQLNLITCYGAFNYQSGQYDKRSIVVSKLISNS